jgi:hypothetical protein
MKKLLLIIACMTLAGAGSAQFAPKVYSDVFNPNTFLVPDLGGTMDTRHLPGSEPVQDGPDFINSRCTGGLGWNYSGGWVLHDSIKVTWSGTRGGDNYSLLTIVSNYDQFTKMEWDGSTWVYTQMLENEFNASGLLTIKTMREWAAGVWDPMGRYLFEYNSDDLVSTITAQIWSAGVFENSMRISSQYDLSGNITEAVQQKWTAGVWENYSRLITLYDGSSNALEESRYIWSAGNWVPENRHIRTYDANNNMLNDLYQTWLSPNWVNNILKECQYNADQKIELQTTMNWTGTAWENSERNSYVYDGSGNCVTQTDYNWSGKEWSNSSRYLMEYDAQNDMIAEINQLWSLGEWSDYLLSNYQYNSYHQCTFTTDYMWSGSWAEMSRSRINYQEYNDGLFVQTPGGLSAKVFPNPFTRNVVFLAEWPGNGTLRLTITDILGNAIYEEERLMNAGSASVFWEGTDRNGKSLSPGIYIYRLQLGERAALGKLIKKE